MYVCMYSPTLGAYKSQMRGNIYFVAAVLYGQRLLWR